MARRSPACSAPPPSPETYEAYGDPHGIARRASSLEPRTNPHQASARVSPRSQVLGAKHLSQSRVVRCRVRAALSYAWLVAGLIDFQIAKDEHILPSDVKWKAWTKLIQEVLEWKDKNYDNDNSRSSSLPAQNNRSLQPQPAIINKRYEFGELRLSRLNSLYRLTPSIFSIRNLVLGFMPGSAWYQEFFERNFSWILAVLVYLSVLLSAMQAGLATDTLQGNRRFQKICTVFALASIFFAYLVLNFPNEMSLDSPLKRVVQSVTDNIHDKDSDGHRGKRPKFDKPLGTSGSSSVPDTDTSPGSLVSDHHVQDALQLEDDQLCGESSPPPYSEAI
ncbi:hypothetical protein AnigIFM62618_004366, partial [Aspergillus niger]